jgi:flagellar hook protein FlgE
MGILSSMNAGVSGINASGTQISLIADNIANVNTPGFKTSRAEFQDVLAGNLGGVGGAGQVGAGTRVDGINQIFTQGSLESTGVTTDLAADGEGFFVVEDTTGRYYTRAGMFRLDNQRVLVNEQGQNVLGFGITNGVPNGALGNIDLSAVSNLPSATTQIEVSVNLDPSAPVITTAFDHLDPASTTNYQTGLRVFDSLGNAHSVQVYFRRTATPNEWEWYAGTQRGDVDATGLGMVQGGAAVQNQFVVAQSGTLTFDTNGTLLTEDNTALSIDRDADGDGVLDGAAAATAQTWPWSGGAAGGTIAFDFGTPVASGGTGADLTTQFGGGNFVRLVDQDGYTSGSLQSIAIEDDGSVIGSFSNGQTELLAQIALARFASVDGLDRTGRNNYLETIESGQAIVGSPNQSGFGKVRSGFLEQSNTDLADQFVKLIVSQRAFQANTRTISTTNELLAQLVQLGN